MYRRPVDWVVRRHENAEEPGDAILPVPPRFCFDTALHRWSRSDYRLMAQLPEPAFSQLRWIRKLLVPSVTFALPPLGVVKVVP